MGRAPATLAAPIVKRRRLESDGSTGNVVAGVTLRYGREPFRALHGDHFDETALQLSLIG